MKSAFNRFNQFYRQQQPEKKEEPFFGTKSTADKIQQKSDSAFFKKQDQDPYEKEADAVATNIVDNKSANKVVQKDNISTIHRQAEEEEKPVQKQEEEETQAKPEEEELKQGKAEEEEEPLQGKAEEEEKPLQGKGEEEEQPLQGKTEEKEEKSVKRKPEEEEIKQGKAEEEEPLQAKEEKIKRKSNKGFNGGIKHINKKLTNSKGQGHSISDKSLAEMEHAFGYNFKNVKIHTDADSVQMNKDLHSQAFAHGTDIYFNSGKYNTDTNNGKRLLAHELTHVVQQGKAMKSIQRKESEDKKEKPTLNYKKALKANEKFAGADSLGWLSKLETIKGGAFKVWSDLWRAGKYDEFADVVAQYQIDNGYKKKEIDGILGLSTWSKIGGYGEAMAGIERVKGDKANEVCTLGTKERIESGHKLATMEKFKLPEGKTDRIFNIILQSQVSKMQEIEEQYRGTGAAGAMVYAGKATFVSEADIWAGALRPGALIQVWSDKAAYELMRIGYVEYKTKKGKIKTRPIKDSDANFFGTSAVFMYYDDPKKPEKMRVRHFSGAEWFAKGDYSVFVTANID